MQTVSRDYVIIMHHNMHTASEVYCNYILDNFTTVIITANYFNNNPYTFLKYFRILHFKTDIHIVPTTYR